MKYRYFKVSPRGFANEVYYFRIREDEVAHVEETFADYENSDDDHSRYACWTNDKIASMPEVALEWTDRRYVLGTAYE